MVQLLERSSQSQTRGRTAVIACATVIEEMRPHLPPGVAHQVLDFGLHIQPEALRHALQEAVDAASESAETIILGYGLCSQAVVGLRANGCTLVVPKVDDCIAIFLGSGRAYLEQQRAEPGSYYLTKGWIEVSDTLLDEYERTIARYGQQRADRMMRIMLKNYTRLAFIDTGQYEQERYREYARNAAERLQLRYEEIPGSDALVIKMLNGPWDDNFVIARPGQTITYMDFKSDKHVPASASPQAAGGSVGQPDFGR
ncbi:MAG: DUF1638 domain-containing protein [Anaerolineae bacterium]|nr:DUF1638 domain-containing protein [Anaerolineae bacterium]